MIVLGYIVLVACGLVVGACAGGITGKISIGEADNWLRLALVGAFVVAWLSHFIVGYLGKSEGVTPMVIYIIVVVCWTVVAFIGARSERK